VFALGLATANFLKLETIVSFPPFELLVHRRTNGGVYTGCFCVSLER
jgi:hypothetical protein